MASVLGDEDLWCDDDTMSDFRTVSGRAALGQALYRRWTTDRGTLIDDPNYGTNLTDFVNDDIGRGDIAQIVSAACAEAQEDERVQSITGEGVLTKTGTLLLTFVVVDSDGPFTLTVSVSEVTVELLTVQQ